MGMRPETLGTSGTAGGGPLTAHAGAGLASYPPSPGARLGAQVGHYWGLPGG